MSCPTKDDIPCIVKAVLKVLPVAAYPDITQVSDLAKTY